MQEPDPWIQISKAFIIWSTLQSDQPPYMSVRTHVRMLECGRRVLRAVTSHYMHQSGHLRKGRKSFSLFLIFQNLARSLARCFTRLALFTLNQFFPGLLLTLHNSEYQVSVTEVSPSKQEPNNFYLHSISFTFLHKIKGERLCGQATLAVEKFAAICA